MQNDKRYTNYAIRNKNPLYSSYYVKPTGEYDRNGKYNYAVNFYNKLDQLENMKKKYGIRTKVTDKDIEKAHNILRLEVQIRRRKLKEICKNNHIDYELCQLNTFINIVFCCRTIKDIYCKFITKDINEFAHFYTYAAAKKKN